MTTKKNKGFTLVELLCTTIICVLAFSLVIMVIQFTMNKYESLTIDSQKQLLANTLQTAIKDELRYAQNIDSQGEHVTYFSQSRGQGKNCYLQAIDGKVVIVNDNGDVYGLVGASEYGEGITVDLVVTYQENTGFHVNLSFSDNMNNATLEKSFIVVPLN